MLRHSAENATMFHLVSGALDRFDGSRFPGSLTKLTMQQAGIWHRMDGLRFPIYLKLARPESKQGLTLLSGSLPLLGLGTAGVPACRLSLL